jgi:uncharacterized protein (TIGR02391 family)
VAWTLGDSETLALPINELAIRVLRDFRANAGWNSGNWLLGAKSEGASPDALRALSEAWAWLESRGLVAWDPSQTTPQSRFVTRLGMEALDVGVARMEAGQRLGVALHPLIAQTVERQFLLGEYELAVFAAMKAVEVRVRELAGGPDALIGVQLMQHAFAPTAQGPLVDADAEGGEQVAMMELYKGAIGVFKNPSSHRPVDYGDPVIAAAAVLLADLVLRMLAYYVRRAKPIASDGEDLRRRLGGLDGADRQGARHHRHGRTHVSLDDQTTLCGLPTRPLYPMGERPWTGTRCDDCRDRYEEETP